MDYAEIVATIGAANREALDAMRQSIRNGDCPFCYRTGFRVVAQHIWKVHGTTRDDLSNLLGFTFTERICSAEASEVIRRAQGPGYKGKKGIGRKKATKSLAYRRLIKERGSVIAKRLGADFHRKGAVAANTKRTGRRVTPKHGTVYEYARYKCRCEPCKAAMAEANKKYRANEPSS